MGRSWMGLEEMFDEEDERVCGSLRKSMGF